MDKELVGAAKVEAESFIQEIESRCRKVLLNAHYGTWDEKVVARQLRAVIRSYLEPSEEPRTFARAMKVRDKEQHRLWRQRKASLSRQDRLIADIVKGWNAEIRGASPSEREVLRGRISRMRVYQRTKRGYPEKLNKTQVQTRLRTGWNRWYNRGVIQQAQGNPDVVLFEFTTKRDRRVCEICRAYDGVRVKKDSPELTRISAPLHYRCRCRWAQVTRAMNLKPTKKLPDVEPAEGFGGVQGDFRR